MSDEETISTLADGETIRVTAREVRPLPPAWALDACRLLLVDVRAGADAEECGIGEPLRAALAASEIERCANKGEGDDALALALAHWVEDCCELRDYSERVERRREPRPCCELRDYSERRVERRREPRPATPRESRELADLDDAGELVELDDTGELVATKRALRALCALVGRGAR